MKYRKLPVVVNAWPVADLIKYAKEDWGEMPEEVNLAYDICDILITTEVIHINTLEGMHVANKDCMLIQGVEGEFYGCEMNIFNKTYEEVE